MQRIYVFACYLAILLVSTGTGGIAFAETTGWMTHKQARNYAPFKNRQAYAKAVACRQGKRLKDVELRFETTGVDAKNKPFHKWNFVVALSSELNREISRIPLRDHPELKYRIVNKNAFRRSDGKQVVCAVVFRGDGPV